ncbi:disulfide bond formation protein B [Sphingomonas colocasiae]|uniref:Disulfide bond formation protein B n=1 Tax=Sphingomonas colocasiae TaxID=1848973 RepID=A0ABS7PZF0_9SPHN|nr:disulfide bond formation protein B [Sphingomonas colocasiae]MBY8826020.1 disulfide bond formation protein B [Sphingomonas colocasiae]
MDRLKTARALALLTPALLMAGALGSQYLGGLYPCEMCHWQRWPHYAAIPLALLAILLRGQAIGRLFLALAALAILTSGAIGAFHAGVEYGWWEGLTSCSRVADTGGNVDDMLRNLMTAPVIRCDQAQWTLAGISLAGFNAIFSIGAAFTIFGLMMKARKA